MPVKNDPTVTKQLRAGNLTAKSLENQQKVGKSGVSLDQARALLSELQTLKPAAPKQAAALTSVLNRLAAAIDRAADPKLQPASQQGVHPLKSLDVELTAGAVSDTERQAVLERAEQKLRANITQNKDVTGTGQEAAGKGDPRLTERGTNILTLLAKKGSSVDELGKISDPVATQAKWLLSSEKREYTADGSGQFDWNKSNQVRTDELDKEFHTRVDNGKTRSAGFSGGSAPYFEASDGSVYGLALLDGSKKTAGLADAVLQFRARADQANVQGRDNRIDRIGPVLVAEQRMLLAGAKLEEGNPASMKEYALLREVIASHPTSSVNGLFDARNAVAEFYQDGVKSRWEDTGHATDWVWSQTPPGASNSAYKSIHHNFSRDTPNNIRCFINEWMFPVGDKALRGDTFNAFVTAMTTARDGDPASAKMLLERIGAGPMKKDVGAAVAQLLAKPDAELAQAVADYLKSVSPKDLGTKLMTNLECAARVYRAVCAEQPSARTLEKEIFRAGESDKLVAGVVARLDAKDDFGALRELGLARLGVQQEVFKSTLGEERHQLITFDGKLQRLGNELLGSAVEKIGTIDTPAERGNALIALQSALRGAVASGLDALKDAQDPVAGKNVSLGGALKDVDALLTNIGDGKKVSDDDYRAVMCTAMLAIKGASQDIRSFYDARMGALALAGVEIDHAFHDQLAKQLPLHYATAICQKGMRVGLEEVITPRSIENVKGMRVLNGVGPVAFSHLALAENSKELAKAGTSKNDLAVLFHLEVKKMVAVGGLLVDNAHAPGGNSHLNMYAMNNGIPVVALPDLRDKYVEFFENARKEGGVYIDDTNGNFRMMTLQKAVEDGLIAGAKVGDQASIDAAIEKLRPGTNRKIQFLKPTSDGMSFEVAAKHDAMISDQRITRHVEIYLPQEEVRGVGKGNPTFDELATLGIHARHLAGEKGTVLALLRSDPELRPFVPDGSQTTPGDIKGMLRDAPIGKTKHPTLAGCKTLNDAWEAVWAKDPKVGVVDDSNFLKSEFYTNPQYRAALREELQELTKQALTSNMLAPDGKSLTAAGQAFYDTMMRNPSLSHPKNGSTIHRSSFTAEDRPGKSGAGQYESYVDRKLANGILGKDVVDGMFKTYVDARVARDEAATRLDIGNMLKTLGDLGASPASLELLWQPVEERNKSSSTKNMLERVRTANNGFPTDEQLTAMRDYAATQPAGFVSTLPAVDELNKTFTALDAKFEEVVVAHNKAMGPARVAGVIGVIESTWMPEPIENNVAEQFFLKHVGPTVVNQATVAPDISGVMISRNVETGAYNEVSAQLVKGFGGGVDGGKTTEAVITAGSVNVSILNGEQKTGNTVDVQGIAVSDADMKQLRDIVLKVEKFFNAKIEPGKRHAVDMEVARQDGKWQIVQARVILMDK